MRTNNLALIIEVFPYAIANGASIWAGARGRIRLGAGLAWLAYGLAAGSLVANVDYPLNFIVWMVLWIGQTGVVVSSARVRRIERQAAQASREAQAHRDAIHAMFEAEMREWGKP